MKKKTVGVYGGSFDPIHLGHLNLSLELFERCNLDEVLFCPVFCSPFKIDRPPMESPHHRLEMLRLALQDIPQFQISSLEIDRAGPSYTVDTLRSLASKEIEYRLLLSEETAAHLHLWKEPFEILRLAPPLIGSRSGGEHLVCSPLKKQLLSALVSTPIFDIQSTRLRKRLFKKLYCGHLIPHKALDYIQKNQLYLRSK